MNDGNNQQETPQEITKALEQLQALQLQQAKLQIQTAGFCENPSVSQAQVQGPSDADLLSLQLPPDFGGKPAEHSVGASSSGGGTRSDYLEAFQVQDALRFSTMDQDANDGGKKFKRSAPPLVQTPHVIHEELKSSLSSLSSRLQDGFNATLGKATAELNSLVSTSVGESLHELQQQFNARCAATEAEVAALKANASQHEQHTAHIEVRTAAHDSIIQQMLQREQQRDKDAAERLQRLEEGQNNMAQKVEQDVDRRLVEDPAYSRPPNRTILRLGTQDDTKITVIRDV